MLTIRAILSPVQNSLPNSRLFQKKGLINISIWHLKFNILQTKVLICAPSPPNSLPHFSKCQLHHLFTYSNILHSFVPFITPHFNRSSNPIGSIFKLYPEFNHFSPLPLLIFFLDYCKQPPNWFPCF